MGTGRTLFAAIGQPTSTAVAAQPGTILRKTCSFGAVLNGAAAPVHQRGRSGFGPMSKPFRGPATAPIHCRIFHSIVTLWTA
eukprot:4692553-Pyramimonas_sp.AAC.1